MLKSKRIWFVSHYSMPPKYEMRMKTQMFAYYLQKKGAICTIFTASTIHNTSINLINTNDKYIVQTYDGLEFVHIKCSQYEGNGIKRIVNMMQFANRFKKIAKDFETPDVIIADVNCVNFKPIADFAKRFKIKFIVDIRDLWPESIVEYLGFSRKNPIIRFLYYREKMMYVMADNIVFSMEGGKQYIIDHGWDIESGGPINTLKVHHINNGILLSDFAYNSKHYQIDDEELSRNNKFKVVYVGSVRDVNNISMIIDVARELQNRKSEDIQILIYGDGDKRIGLEKRCVNEQIYNISFKGHVDKKYIPYILSRCNLNLMHGASESLGRYGLSLNKSFDYLASGKPTLTDIDCNYDYMVSSGSAVQVDCNYKSVADGIIMMQSLEAKDYQKMCICARETAEKYDYSQLTGKLISIIEG